MDKKEVATKEKQITEGDLIWDELKGKKISFFGTLTPLESLVTRINLLPTQCSLKANTPATAISAMLDEALNVARFDGGEKRFERYNVEVGPAGIINITRINTAV